MYTGQPEKYISTVFAFGEKGQYTATAALFTRSLTAPGGATAAGTEFAVIIPRNGTLKNLYWSADASTLTKPGNKITVWVKDPPGAAVSAPTGLAVTWNANVLSGSNTSNSIPVVAGDTVSVYIELATGQTGKTITRPRVTIELEVDAQNPNPWDLSGPIVSYQGGNVGIGTTSPAGELHVKNVTAGGVAGVFETPSGKILSGRVGASEKFSVDANGNLYTSGKVGIGNTAPATELDVNGTVQTQGIRLPTGAGNSLVLTSDASGNGTWQPTGGSGGTIDGSGTVNAIPMFLGATTLDDSVIFQDGGNIGIGTSTPASTLEVNGAISGFGIVPIGSIIAWHKSLTGTPSLSDGWVECNGQTLSDMGSPYNGQAIPDLNGGRKFLRGSASSGTLEADAFQGHRHAATYNNIAGFIGSADWGWQQTSNNGFSTIGLTITDPTTDGTNGTPRTANETRPVNMSVVWIMRVK